jgi:4-nitrophenyl phosphatase
MLMRKEPRLNALRHLVIDLDGVIYRGQDPIPGAADFIGFLRARNIGFILATNNSTRTPQQYADKLGCMGIQILPHEVLTSAQATAAYLLTLAPPGTRVFVVGMDGLRAALKEAGFALVEEEAEFVVAGMDFTICFERLSQATLLIRAGARFLGTNPDRTFPTERGIIPGAGSLLAFLETATGVTPTVIGKPHTALLDQALHLMGAARSTTAMLGDRLETDILAGQRAGLGTILVLSGVTDRAALAASEIRPDLLFRDVKELQAVWEATLSG